MYGWGGENGVWTLLCVCGQNPDQIKSRSLPPTPTTASAEFLFEIVSSRKASNSRIQFEIHPLVLANLPSPEFSAVLPRVLQSQGWGLLSEGRSFSHLVLTGRRDGAELLARAITSTTPTPTRHVASEQQQQVAARPQRVVTTQRQWASACKAERTAGGLQT